MTDPTDDEATTLWLDPSFGVAGDMVLGALIGLGAPVEDIRAGLVGLGIGGWRLDVDTTLRASLAATRAGVTSAESEHHRTWSSIDDLLAGADLPGRVRSGARATFRRLAEVEAGIHRVDLDRVHFHEVGAVDAIVDIVGAWLALHLLDAQPGRGPIGEVVAGPVGLGSGRPRAAHGRLPGPAPATAELLAGAPVRPVDVEIETATPTGAALLATMADRWGPIPAGRLLATARGAGTRDPEGHPNVVSAHLVANGPPPSARVAAGPGVEAGPDAAVSEPAVVVSTNLDDVTAEVVGHVLTRALACGADDAWSTPIAMKKNRPGVMLSVLCHPDRLADIQALVFAETGTLGLRVQPVDKRALPRRFREVTVRGLTIRMKVGPHGAKPEHDDLVAAAEASGEPLRQLAAEAIAADRARSDDRPG